MIMEEVAAVSAVVVVSVVVALGMLAVLLPLGNKVIPCHCSVV